MARAGGAARGGGSDVVCVQVYVRVVCGGAGQEAQARARVGSAEGCVWRRRGRAALQAACACAACVIAPL
jgi:hypothetical protein